MTLLAVEDLSLGFATEAGFASVLDRVKPMYADRAEMLEALGLGEGALPRFLQTPTSTGYGLGETVAASGLVMLPMLVALGIAWAQAGAATRTDADANMARLTTRMV